MKTDLLDIYSDYLISQNHYATATGLSALFDGEISHDQVSRLLRSGEYGSKELWSYIKSEVRRHEQDSDGVLLLDDTISEKTYTDENAVNCWHFSHAKGRHMKGLNLLSCLVRYGDIALPIGYEIVKKDILYSDIETRRTKRKSSISKNEMFRDLIQQAVSNHVRFDYVLADSWFGSKANMTFIHQNLKKRFIFGIKSNRCVALTQHDAQRGQYQQVNTFEWKDGDANTVYLKDISFPVQILKKKSSKTKTAPQVHFISSRMIYPLMLTAFIQSTKNGGKLKSIINLLSKMPACLSPQPRLFKLNLIIYLRR